MTAGVQHALKSRPLSPDRVGWHRLRTVRVLWTELTQRLTLSGGLVLLLLSLVAGSKASIGDPAPGWANPFNVALTGTLYLGPICAGLAVLTAQDLFRTRTDQLVRTAPFGLGRALLLRCAAVLAWAVSAYIVMVLVVLARTGAVGPPGWADLDLFALGLVVLATCVSLGASAGRVTSLRVAGPIVVFTIFGLVYTGSYLSDSGTRLSPIYSEISYLPYLQPNVGLVGCQIGFIATLGAMPLVIFQARLRLIAVLLVSACVVAAGGILARAANPVEVRGAPSSPKCAGSAYVRVCLRPENAFALHQSAVVLTQAVRNVAPFLKPPSSFSEPGMTSRLMQGFGIYAPPDPGSSEAAYADEAAFAFLPTKLCHRNGVSVEDPVAALYKWLRVRIDPQSAPAYMSAQLSGVLATSPARQRDWLRTEIARATSC